MRLTFEAIAALGLLFLLVAPALEYSALPERIPTHFGAGGEPDGWGSKSSIWTLPVMGAIMFALMTALAGYAGQKEARQSPPELAERRGELTRAFMAGTKAHMVCLFGFITYRSLDVAMGRAAGLGIGIWIALAAFLPLLAWYVVRRVQLS